MSAPVSTPGPAADESPRRGRRNRGGARVSIVGVFGELLVTAGVIVLLFIGWQNWWNSWVLNAQQNGAASQLSKEWLQESGESGDGSTASSAPSGSGSGQAQTSSTIPVSDEPSHAQAVGIMYVPRFGTEWRRTIREGTGDDVLNSYDAGVGHYDGTAMPGGVGNFAVAAHDTGWGNTFLHMQNLRVGDKIYVQTKDGFYTYAFRNYEYVQPTAVDVLLPVPHEAKAKASDRLLTMTTCNPPYHSVERLIAYGVLESFSKTPPAAIASEVG
ncbi:class E sortase [Gryllotalpicola ginsengisoli]|uniref:class E sortase n=1 Tax=Gryllotalpicola ginsengisoli TaxID=444608 RepID=UPI0003B62C11|nr:class E sortase [Gryllotalpicola ginsengisoli]